MQRCWGVMPWCPRQSMGSRSGSGVSAGPSLCPPAWSVCSLSRRSSQTSSPPPWPSLVLAGRGLLLPSWSDAFSLGCVWDSCPGYCGACTCSIPGAVLVAPQEAGHPHSTPALPLLPQRRCWKLMGETFAQGLRCLSLWSHSHRKIICNWGYMDHKN